MMNLKGSILQESDIASFSCILTFDNGQKAIQIQVWLSDFAFDQHAGPR